MFVLEGSLHEAAYFRAISRGSKLTVDLVQFSEPRENEDSAAPVLRAMEGIRKYKADVILLYIKKENVELILQQVITCDLILNGPQEKIIIPRKIEYLNALFFFERQVSKKSPLREIVLNYNHNI